MISTSQRWLMVFSAAALSLLLMIAGAGNASAAGVAPKESRTSTIEQADASSGGDRPSFYGIVKSMPEGGTVGEWMIGDQMVFDETRTEVQ